MECTLQSRNAEELSFTYAPRFLACCVISSRTLLFASAIARDGMLANNEPWGSGSPWTGLFLTVSVVSVLQCEYEQ